MIDPEKKYLIVTVTEDPFGNTEFKQIRAAKTRTDIIKDAKSLPHGTYALICVIRPKLEVRDSQRVVETVVDWGTTNTPRKRKTPTGAKTTRKAAKAAKGTLSLAPDASENK